MTRHTTTAAHELADPLPLSDIQWAIVLDAVKNYEAGSDQMQREATDLHHMLRLLNDRQVVRLVRDRNK